MILKQITLLLNKVLETTGVDRINYIKEFQETIWNTETIECDILSTLAYDLDFYEPNKELQKEFHGYYGDNRLFDEIEEVIEKLKEYKDTPAVPPENK